MFWNIVIIQYLKLISTCFISWSVIEDSPERWKGPRGQEVCRRPRRPWPKRLPPLTPSLQLFVMDNIGWISHYISEHWNCKDWKIMLQAAPDPSTGTIRNFAATVVLVAQHYDVLCYRAPRIMAGYCTTLYYNNMSCQLACSWLCSEVYHLRVPIKDPWSDTVFLR